MNETFLELAIAERCDETGCQLRLAGNGQETVAAVYTTRMLNRVKVYPGQLVAINRQTEPPEIVWRWYRMQITSLGENDLILDDRGVRQIIAQRAPGFNTELQIGNWVWVGGVGWVGPDEIWEAFDLVSPEGDISQPERVRALVFPGVIAFYNAANA